jgi:hypothetical protein
MRLCAHLEQMFQTNVVKKNETRIVWQVQSFRASILEIMKQNLKTSFSLHAMQTLSGGGAV